MKLHAPKVNDDVCIKFYIKKEPLYLKTDALGIGLGIGLLQARDSFRVLMTHKHLKTLCSDLYYLAVRTSQAQKQHTAKQNEKHWEYFMATPLLLFCLQVKHNNRSQAIGGHIRDSCGIQVIKVTTRSSYAYTSTG